VNGWNVELRPLARRQLRLLPEGPRQAALDVFDELRELGPALVEAIRMRGYVETWRVRFHHDAYRMVYQVSRTRRHTVVTRMRPRPIAYEGMKH
jgi:mRNA-degrading endonuclease RelE of RelBE toxin-antitoxin system